MFYPSGNFHTSTLSEWAWKTTVSHSENRDFSGSGSMARFTRGSYFSLRPIFFQGMDCPSARTQKNILPGFCQIQLWNGRKCPNTEKLHQISLLLCSRCQWLNLHLANFFCFKVFCKFATGANIQNLSVSSIMFYPQFHLISFNVILVPWKSPHHFPCLPGASLIHTSRSRASAAGG